MSFPRVTEKDRRKQRQDEEAASRAIAGYHKTMADILCAQSKINVLRPAPPLRSRGFAKTREI